MVDCKDCKHYVEWSYSRCDGYEQPCVSCELQGESHTIDKSKCPINQPEEKE